MRIAVSGFGFLQWGGGIDFVRHILTSLLLADGRAEHDVVLVLPADTKRNVSLTNVGGASIATSAETFSELDWQIEVVHSDQSLHSHFERLKNTKPDVVMPCFAPPPANFSIPWVGYLYDFQHSYLPHLFTPQDRAQRDVSFYSLLMQSHHVIVNSLSVANDARRFYNNFLAKIHVLPFSPHPQKVWLEKELDVREKYRISKRYFIICNQFWKHKNHTTALRAFSKFISLGHDVSLVCTGETVDYRFPDYFDEIRNLVISLGIEDRVLILGHIPKLDQIGLIKHAVALIQPTLFEGGPGGGASYDAISLGIPVICSAIPVNLEMNYGDVRYFDADNIEQLTLRLCERCAEEPSITNRDDLWRQGIERKRSCGETLLDVASQAINDSRVRSLGKIPQGTRNMPPYAGNAILSGEQDRASVLLTYLLEQITKLDLCESDREARGEQIETLTRLIKESEVDREARGEQIETLTRLIKESEVDREARGEQIETLTRLIKESEVDREARGEQIETLTRLLNESEIVRSALGEKIESLMSDLRVLFSRQTFRCLVRFTSWPEFKKLSQILRK